MIFETIMFIIIIIEHSNKHALWYNGMGGVVPLVGAGVPSQHGKHMVPAAAPQVAYAWLYVALRGQIKGCGCACL